MANLINNNQLEPVHGQLDWIIGIEQSIMTYAADNDRSGLFGIRLRTSNWTVRLSRAHSSGETVGKSDNDG